MKRCIVPLCCLATLAFGCSRAVPHQEKLSITPATLATLIRARVPMTLLDARIGEHDDGRRIPGARSIAPDASDEEIARAAPSKDGLVVVYCKDPQCPNFARLAARMRELGYVNVLEHPPGIEGWVAEGLTVASDATAGAAGRR